MDVDSKKITMKRGRTHVNVKLKEGLVGETTIFLWSNLDEGFRV